MRIMLNRSLLALAIAIAVSQPSSTPAQTTATVVDVRIKVGLVLPDLSVRPVPLHTLELRLAEDSLAPARAIRTALDGTVQMQVSAGKYRIRSQQPVTLGDSAYAWDIHFEIPQAGASLELSNVNAVVTATQLDRSIVRQATPERAVFERARRGVFRIEAGLGHGSGFYIAEHGGLVVTNDHVIGTADFVSVYLDSATRAPAQIVTRDRLADLAILRVAKGRCGACVPLPLASSSDVVAGERLLAIGFPLNQEQTLTSGIASSIRDGAIISDVNINHGNSGGPMLNAAGEVVGVNAFGDFATNGGPGISGAIAVARLRPLLDSVPRASAALNDNFDRILPTAPAASYPVALLQQIADTAPTKHYARLLDRNANKFLISITTPVTAFVSIKASESDVAGDRRKREARAGVASDQKYSELAQHRDWAQYVGSPTTAVVTVTIQPKIAETFWSALGRGLEAYSYGGSISQAKMKFAGDVRGARFYRNGIEVEPIRGGHGPQAFRIDNRWVQLKDVADMGYYVLPIEAFMPDSLGRPPIVSIVISDLKNPSTLSAADILDGDAARVWNDFVPYFQSVRPSAGARFVDTRLRSERIPLICDAVAAACVRQ